uniref:Major facilitator superfamily (MFS) profile domain-containing protein n=1 Tax=Acrobeloides nanus TaxID=290746 RepID=A0A914C4C0_9BILA
MRVDPVAEFLTRLPQNTRICIVITGAVLIHLSLGTYHTFGNMLPYMASYMQNYTDSSIRLEHLIWIPTFQGCFPFAMIIGGYLTSRLGPRLAAAVGCGTMVSGVCLSYWTIQQGFWPFLFTYGFMFGLGQGIAYVIAVSVVINWAPHMVGFGSGIVAAGFGISSSIFAPIQTHLVNPKNYAPSKEGYFPQGDLLEKVPGIFFSLSIIYAIMQAIGLIVICDPPPQNGLLSHKDMNGTCSIETHHEVENGSDSDSEIDFGSEPVSLTPREMLKSSTFYWLFAALFCCSFYGNLFYNLYKTFGETFIQDDMFLAVAFSIGSIANAIARIGWGILTDRTSFQFTLSIATCMATVLLLTMPLTAAIGSKWLFLFWLIGMFICMAATHALFITAAVRCFGTEHKTINYGCLILSTTFSGVLLALGTQYFFLYIGYFWMFIGAAIFPFAAFLLISSIKLTPQGHLVI